MAAAPGPSRASSGPEVTYEDGPEGVRGVAPKEFFPTTPLSLPENEGNAPVMTNCSKRLLNISCKGYTKHCVYKSRTAIYASNALFVPEGTSNSKAEKIEREWELNDPTTPTTGSLG